MFPLKSHTLAPKEKKKSNNSKEHLIKMKPQKDVTENYSDIFTHRITHIKPAV